MKIFLRFYRFKNLMLFSACLLICFLMAACLGMDSKPSKKKVADLIENQPGGRAHNLKVLEIVESLEYDEEKGWPFLCVTKYNNGGPSKKTYYFKKMKTQKGKDYWLVCVYRGRQNVCWDEDKNVREPDGRRF